MKRYVLVEVKSEGGAAEADELAGGADRAVKRALGHYFHNSPRTFRTADVTDLVAYDPTPDDPWQKPYPAMYETMFERLT